MKKLFTQPTIKINLAALRKNYNFLQSLAGSAQCSAVVKNNAYGLGTLPVVEALKQAGCKTFWVAHAFEGTEIRPSLENEKIIVLMGPCDETMEFYEKFNLTPVINNLQQLSLWKKRCKNKGFVLHIDSGLNRYGLREEELNSIISQQELPTPEMLMSHLACADSCGHFMNEYQLKKFQKYRALFPGIPATLSASDGVFLGSEFSCEMIRAGAALYGINTAPYRENQMSPVVFIEAPVLQKNKLLKGQYVGYGATYRANVEKKVAVLAVGYGDGIPYQLTNKGKVYFKRGKERYEARILGKVSMDITVCDITDIPAGIVNVGTMASIIDENYTVDDMGRDALTTGYEIISRLGNRYKKVYSHN